MENIFSSVGKKLRIYAIRVEGVFIATAELHKAPNCEINVLNVDGTMHNTQ